MSRERLPIRLLGQSGCRIEFPETVVYCDPYLSDSVREVDSPDLERLRPIPIRPQEVGDADWVLVTHDHPDHCDPHTLPLLAETSPNCRFLGPSPVLARLAAWGVAQDRCAAAEEEWAELAPGLAVRAVPAAHPSIERDERGRPLCVGYVLEWRSRRLYLAGDTSVDQELLETLETLRPLHAALLPVNERNYFRDRRNILGNMSVREAFLLAREIGVEQVVPVHWDMFAANEVRPEEMLAVYDGMQPGFALHLSPSELEL